MDGYEDKTRTHHVFTKRWALNGKFDEPLTPDEHPDESLELSVQGNGDDWSWYIHISGTGVGSRGLSLNITSRCSYPDPQQSARKGEDVAAHAHRLAQALSVAADGSI